MTEDRPNWKDMVTEIDGMSRDVTSWEANFLQSMRDLIDAELDPTPEQLLKLRQMYERYFPGGVNVDAEIDM